MLQTDHIDTPTYYVETRLLYSALSTNTNYKQPTTQQDQKQQKLLGQLKTYNIYSISFV